MTGPRLSASLVHSVVATALIHPDGPNIREDDGTASQWSTCPQDVGLDMASVSDFAGLAEKVRHNQVRHDLEMTFRLLRLSGIEIAFFRDYVPTSLARRKMGLTRPADRLAGLAEFAPTWAGDDAQRCVVRDVLVHECILAMLRGGNDDGIPGGDRDTRRRVDGTGFVQAARPDCVPVLNGQVFVRSMICDPDQVALVLRDREPDLTSIRLQSRTAIYHRAPSSGLRILSTGTGVGELLRAVDDEADVRTLAGRLRISDSLVAALVRAYVQLCELGVVQFVASGVPHETDAR